MRSFPLSSARWRRWQLVDVESMLPHVISKRHPFFPSYLTHDSNFPSQRRHRNAPEAIREIICTYLGGCDARARQPTKLKYASESPKESVGPGSIRHRAPNRPQSSVNGRPIGFGRDHCSKELEMPIGNYALRRPRQDMEEARSRSCQMNACPINCRC